MVSGKGYKSNAQIEAEVKAQNENAGQSSSSKKTTATDLNTGAKQYRSDTSTLLEQTKTKNANASLFNAYGLFS